jgi:hypothetical protein
MLVLPVGDQRPGPLQRLLVYLDEGAVGGEHAAGVAGVALVTGSGRWQQAEPVGQDPVGTAVQLEQVIHGGAVHRDLLPVRADLDEVQECLLGGLVADG